ncbi:Na(+)-translocating NADH-quinone reductase subunit A [Candidatus Rhodobacter oscarellae]|uniref:Na(+)-translocating NADH-quinone reductase subunit A n=1 Tax=Candidatus Rhodobacter oscarellae TaxID=1675527 RepID=A0A0J9E0G4_9RHOB|nr:Na(+)-translocating NADH-quinone reductase subunit A [Candidatus Rhodobacter lobularis]KMW56210.1 Na(+)-translocating NADH-quinone reductase subunit A [Candidatus Rhodobacter lobularis]
MKHFKLRKGLDLPITGAPRGEIGPAPTVRTVAVLGDDYLGLKPRITVEEGAAVVPGTPLMFDKNMPEAQVVSPVAGRVRAINRGARRKLISIEIDIDSENGGAPVDFSSLGDASTREGLTERLCAAGLWTSLRTRPYSKVPAPGSAPSAIYITAMDTEPLAADPALAITESAEAFAKGVETVARLSDGPTYLCQGEGAPLPGHDLPGVEAAQFSGPHPAGLAGTHMHFLTPPSADSAVWTIGYQDVIVIGRLMLTGHYDAACLVALTGPACKEPRLVRSVMGASMLDLTQGDLPEDLPVRLISGSVLSGRAGAGPSAYLGRYARQITVIEEDKKQIPLGWIRPMFAKYAFQPVLGSAMAKKLYPLTSNLNGGRRAMVPLGTFEELMPQDFLPTQLLRALLVMDTDQAQLLGALELDEEDLGLVGFACPAKYEYGLALRDCLTKIEKEG